MGKLIAMPGQVFSTAECVDLSPDFDNKLTCPKYFPALLALDCDA